MNSHWPLVTKDTPCPVCGKDHSCRIAPDGTAAVCWRNGNGGNVIQFGKAATNFGTRQRLVRRARSQVRRKLVVTYPYRDESGEVRYEVQRWEPKGFSQRRPDGRGGHINNMKGVKRLPYRLPDLLDANEERPDEWRFIVEGEKDVESMLHRGLIATCNAGGAGNWQPEFADVLAGQKVCVIADKDEPGRRHAQLVARTCHGKAATVCVIELPGDDIKDATDFTVAGGTRREFIELAETAPEWLPPGPDDNSRATPSNVDDGPDPRPLPVGLPPVLGFDYSMLPESQRLSIVDVAERMQCPPDYCGVTMLVVAGALIGRKLVIRPKQYDNWSVVPNLFGMCVGRPSLMKSPAMKESLRFLETQEREAAADYAHEVEEYASEQLIRAAKEKVAKEQLKAAVRKGEGADAIAKALTDRDMQPIRRRLLINNATVEKLGEILAQNPNGVVLFADELVAFFRSMDREGHEADRGFYLTAWGGDTRYAYDRIGRGTVEIPAAIVSIIGSIQPGVLVDYLAEAMEDGRGADGLIQRFQLAVYPDVSGTWINTDRMPNIEARALADAAMGRLMNLSPDGVDAQRDNDEPYAQPFLRFDPEAQELFNIWRAGLEARLLAGDEHEAVESHLGKYRSLMPSLALILHLLDGGVGPVNATATRRAIQWTKYLESHARRLYASVVDAPTVAAKLLAKKIQAGKLTSPFALRDVYRPNWNGLDKTRAEQAVEVLRSLGWLIEERMETEGRPRVQYRVHPKIRISPEKELTELTEAPSVSSGSDGTEPKDFSRTNRVALTK